ncbi:hypothetical protein [Loktanella sp. 3ANDIMAR09]|uniref:hypothetical protein n=1 Tax=Loktanella sp. 3ANDIMAR09 TaxID=1225657 RepID=UPI000AF6EDF3|nr:hypothetical protein [Loktanella sp. 3ANDIMAR09]
MLEAIAAMEQSGCTLVRADEPGIAHDFSKDNAQSLARKLVGKGLIIRRGRGRYRLSAAGHRALAVPGATLDPMLTCQREKPRRGIDPLPYERAWKAIRIQRRFTHASIMTVVSTPASPANPRNIRGYIAGLVAAGYVRVVYRPGRASVTGGSSPRQYALVEDTGSAAPAVRRASGVLHDPNLKRDIPLTPAPEREDA